MEMVPAPDGSRVLVVKQARQEKENKETDSLIDDTLVLRDHSQPCEHGTQAFQLKHGGWACRRLACPGGEKVTLVFVGIRVRHENTGKCYRVAHLEVGCPD